jgi:hypothetical protein
MRDCRLALVLLAALLVPVPASAAAPPQNVLFAGTIQRRFLASGSGNWCLFEGSNSTFIRRGGITLISFPNITIAPTGSVGPVAYTLGGQAILRFSQGSTTTGIATFMPVVGNSGSDRTPAFTDYVAVYKAAPHLLTVRFNLHFGSCVLPVVANYRN